MMTSANSRHRFDYSDALLGDQLARWHAERAAQRCDECQYFAPIGGTRGEGECKQSKLRSYTRECDRCDAFERGAKREPVDAETFAAATLPRWILKVVG